jgi:hypothetical protein
VFSCLVIIGGECDKASSDEDRGKSMRLGAEDRDD